MTEKGKALTPGGYRDIAQIHPVASDERVHRTENGHEIRKKKSGEVVKAIPADEKDPLNLPKRSAALVPGGTADGWQAYADWTNDTGTPIRMMRASWVVPPPPADIGNQTVFLFPGIQNMAGNAGILQPVLQWGVSFLGGGAYWSVASWYVPTTGDAFFSKPGLMKVLPGQPLKGIMTLTAPPPGGAAGGVFNYDCTFDGIAGTDLATADLPELTWANLTLEAYSVANRNQYPATPSTTYTDINIIAGAGLTQIPWQKTFGARGFGEDIKIIDQSISNGAIAIQY